MHDYRRRGFRIEPAGSSASAISAAQGFVTPAARVFSPAAALGSSHASVLQKLHGVYNILEQRALYLSPVLDVSLSGGREVPLDESATQKTGLGGESYNSMRLFTLLTTVVGDGRMLIFGPPSSGKTSTSSFVGVAVYNLLMDYMKRCTLLGHPEQTEEKMVAMYDPVKMLRGEKQLITREWMKSPVKIIDEITRLRPESLSILIEIMQSGTATYQGEVIQSTPGPVFATANPPDSGSFELPPPIVDRFDIGVSTGSINPYYIESLAVLREGTIRRNLEKVILPDPLTPAEMEQARREARARKVPSEVMSRLAHFLAEISGCNMAGVEIESKSKGYLSSKKPPALCAECSHFSKDANICSSTENDIGSRSVNSIVQYAKALAWWRGNAEVSADDAKAVVPYAVWFKLVPTRAAYEADTRFVNDRISLVRHLYEKSQHSFDALVAAIPAYASMTALVLAQTLGQPSSKGKKDLEDMIGSAAKLDTPAKYPLITALKKMYHDSR